MREYQHLLTSVEDDILTITMNRPHVENAVNGVMHTELAQVFQDARAEEARVIVLTGAGDAFQVAGDLAWFSGITQEDWWRVMREARWILKDMMLIEQPLIVKLNGRASGVGLSMALAGDLIYVAEEAVIDDPHVAFGVACGDGTAALLPNLVSLTKAKELMFFSRQISGRELADLGIANRCVPREELDAVVQQAALELAAQPPQALRWSKIIANKVAENSLNAILDQATAFEGWGWTPPK